MQVHQMRQKNQLFSKFLLHCGLLLVLLLSAATSHAQEDPSPQRGFHSAGSYALSDLETIDTVNGNLMFHIPLASLPAGRGGNPGYNLRLFYNSKLWDTLVETYLSLGPESGWRYEIGYELQVLDRNGDVGNPYACPDWRAPYRWRLKMTFPDGSKHEFRPDNYGDVDGYFPITPDGWLGSCTGSQLVTGPVNYYSIDGSYLRLTTNQDGNQDGKWTLYFPDGGRVTGSTGAGLYQPQRTYDRNDNYTELQAITLANGHSAHKIVDQLGRYLQIEYDNALQQDYITMKSVGGAQLKWTVKWKNITVHKHYTNSGTSVFMTQTIKVVDQIIPPVQLGLSSYIFGYNPGATNPSYGWGEVSSVTLPSGAQASYAYTNDGVNYLDKSQILKNAPTRKDLTYQQEYDGVSTPTTETWSYSIGYNQSQITTPTGGIIRHYFNNSTYARDWGQVYKEDQIDGSVVERIWQENMPVPYYGTLPILSTVNSYVKTEFLSIKDAAGNLVKTAIKDFNYDKNGNVTRVAEYDWVAYGDVPRGIYGKPTGIPASAIIKRVTANTYYGPTPDASDSTNDPDVYNQSTSKPLRNIATTEISSNGTQTLARTEYLYDNATTLNLDAVPVKGNLTKQVSWDSTAGTLSRPLAAANSISASYQYDTYGNRTLTTDANGIQTQYVYGAVGDYTNLYPTQINAAYTKAAQRTTNLAYDFYTALVTRSTDVDNNVATATNYDVFGRPTLIQSADGKPEESQVSTTYSDTGRYIIVRSDLSTTGDRKLITIKHYDQLGRIRLTRQLEDKATQSETDETTGIKVQTRYKFASPYSYGLISNAYRAATSAQASTESTMGWTRTKRDNSGRVIAVQSFIGSGLPAPWGAK